MRLKGVLQKGIAVCFIALFVLGAYTLIQSLSASPVITSSQPQPLADTNDDQVVDIFDLSYLLNNWQTQQPRADFNNDNIVGIIDLSYLLAQWGRTDGGQGTDAPDLSALTNPAGLSGYNDYVATSAEQLNQLGGGQYGAFHDNAFTASNFVAEDNGSSPQGQFRLICTVSHFSYDDPIIFPDQPGAAHLHMFWGNTQADARSNFVPGAIGNILEQGSSSCQGGALNRSAYWAPALLSGGAQSDRKIVVPKVITLYYKSHRPWEVNTLPQGIQLLVGNIGPGGSVQDSFTHDEGLHWGCYDPSRGLAVRQASTIPGTNGTPQCPNGWDIQATIQFPQCIASTLGKPVLTSSDFVSHTTQVNQSLPCPSSHPYRVPQISYLIRWENPAGLAEADWRLSSDANFGNPAGQVPFPGGSLHGDWLGGWHEGSIQAWTDGCFLVSTGPGIPGRNCSIGQTGRNGTDRSFRRYSGENVHNLEYTGPQLLDDPAPTYTHGSGHGAP